MINVTAAIIERDGKYLIGRRKSGRHLVGKWEFPGGAIEDGENPKECLRRELKEELGRKFIVGDFFDEAIYDYGHKKIKLIGHYATGVSAIFSLNAHDIIRWVSKDELRNYDFCEADLPFVKKLINLD